MNPTSRARAPVHAQHRAGGPPSFSVETKKSHVVPGLGAFFTATSMIGFIAGAGIIVRNSIILVDFIELKLREGMPLAAAVEEAGVVRFRPHAAHRRRRARRQRRDAGRSHLPGPGGEPHGRRGGTTLLSRLAVPVLYFLVARRGRAAELQREGALTRGRLRLRRGRPRARRRIPHAAEEHAMNVARGVHHPLSSRTAAHPWRRAAARRATRAVKPIPLDVVRGPGARRSRCNAHCERRVVSAVSSVQTSAASGGSPPGRPVANTVTIAPAGRVTPSHDEGIVGGSSRPRGEGGVLVE